MNCGKDLLHFKHMYSLVYSIKHYPKEPAANGTAMAECYMAEAGGKGAGKWDWGGVTTNGFHHWIEDVY